MELWKQWSLSLSSFALAYDAIFRANKHKLLRHFSKNTLHGLCSFNILAHSFGLPLPLCSEITFAIFIYSLCFSTIQKKTAFAIFQYCIFVWFSFRVPMHCLFLGFNKKNKRKTFSSADNNIKKWYTRYINRKREWEKDV